MRWLALSYELSEVTNRKQAFITAPKSIEFPEIVAEEPKIGPNLKSFVVPFVFTLLFVFVFESLAISCNF